MESEVRRAQQQQHRMQQLPSGRFKGNHPAAAATTTAATATAIGSSNNNNFNKWAGSAKGGGHHYGEGPVPSPPCPLPPNKPANHHFTLHLLSGFYGKANKVRNENCHGMVTVVSNGFKRVIAPI